MYLLVSGIDLKNMPPCKDVLLNKIERSNRIVRMMKCGKNIIDRPEPIDGWYLDEKGEFALSYYSGLAFPEDITNLTNETERTESDLDKDDEQLTVSESDSDWSNECDEDNYEESDDEDGSWLPKKK